MTRLLHKIIWIMLSVIAQFSIAASGELKLAVTTSFHNSGLADQLLPVIKQDIGLDVRLIVVGTGQALRLGKSGDVDAILVHSKKAEEAFVNEGYGQRRTEIMFNDFVIVGPKSDPAELKGSSTVSDVFKKIEKHKVIFVSRGDDSGTHKKELAIWHSANLEPNEFEPSWYRASGSGMGSTLNVAIGSDGYVLTDRATWLNFGNKRQHKILFEGDPALYNQYAYLVVNAKKHPHVRYTEAEALELWLTGKKGQQLIGSYKIAGETLFVPNAKRSD